MLEATSQLPTVPKLVQELIESFQDENSDINDISNKIALDQTLTAKVLRLANSPWFGFSREVATIKDASVLLGFNHLRTLVLACGITSAFEYPADFDQHSFWSQSFEIASLAQWVAKYSQADMQEAFTCGMLHNIGQVLIAITNPEASKKIAAFEGEIEAQEAFEIQQLGFCTAELSSYIAKSWRFPESIQYALRWQNNPSSAKDDAALATILHIAEIIQLHKKEQGGKAIENDMPLFLCQEAHIDAAAIITDIEHALNIENQFASMLA